MELAGVQFLMHPGEGSSLAKNDRAILKKVIFMQSWKKIAATKTRNF